MNNGKRDLSKIAVPNGIKEEMLSSPICQMALTNFFLSITNMIKNDDKALLETFNSNSCIAHINIETFMVIDQMLSDIIDNASEHIPGPECPVCLKISQLNLCSRVLLSKWQTQGKFEEYQRILQFRDKAVENGRVLN